MRTRSLALAVVVALGTPIVDTAPVHGTSLASTAGQERPGTGGRAAKLIDLTRWRGSGLDNGSFSHAKPGRGGVMIGAQPTRVIYKDPYGSSGRRAFDRGRWTSPWVRPGFGFDQLIASYNASTPVGTFIEVSTRARSTAGRPGSWDSLGRWAGHDRGFHRMTLGRQADDVARVAVDTLVAKSGTRLGQWQLRLSLFRRSGTSKTPVVSMVAAVASHLPNHAPTSRPGSGAGHSLPVPRYSQEIHRGEYPQYDGGGEAWCSPTSTSMVLGYWDRLPAPRDYAWVDPSYEDPWVDHAARGTFAHGYDGTGDWPFNTAYAGRFGLDAFVTRLRSLREAELFIKAGIPLVASISFGPGELDGAPIRSTSGHLLVIRGFTATGRVVVNDPAASSSRGVRRVYRRGQFENAWSDNGGVVYVIHPASTPLPRPHSHSNW